jgi:hypothetical protein
MTADETSRAQRDLEAIDRLLRNSDFTGYFLRRIGDEIRAAESRICGDPNFPPADFAITRARLHALYEVARLCEADATGCRSLLGLEKDEIPLTKS